jgi:hypothetical protein
MIKRDERCETCYYFEPHYGAWMRSCCRRRAPVAGGHNSIGQEGLGALFPEVDKWDWCGEWKASLVQERGVVPIDPSHTGPRPPGDA